MSAASSPAFLAGTNSSSNQIVLHVKRGFDTVKVGQTIADALSAAGLPCRVIVKAHSLGQLAFPKSLENWLRSFEIDVALYDPTLAFSRARALVEMARSARQVLGANVRGLYFDATQRVAYVLVRDCDASLARVQAGGPLHDALHAAAGRFADGDARSELVVRFVERIDSLNVVAIDNRSAGIRHAFTRWGRRVAIVAAATAALVAMSTGLAAAKSTSATALFKKGGRPKMAQSVSAPSDTHQYGVLPGLSVFGDGGIANAGFAVSGLRLFFDHEASALARHQQVAEVQMPEIRVFGLQIRPRTGVPGQDQDQSGAGQAVGS